MARLNASNPFELPVRGSLITLRRKCGKASCRCAKGKPHETPALSYSVRGATRILTLRRKEVPLVRAALRRHKKAVANLARQALAGIKELAHRILEEKRLEKGGGV